jgi:SAM-dependent methyltransferase
MSRSEEISRAFYAQLGAEGLANRTRSDWDASIVARLTEILPLAARVLDVGCGYGRVTLPLAQAGYKVEGIDLAENLIDAARRTADAQNLPIVFTVGSMTRLPYAPASFDAVVSLWSSFNELLEAEEQRRALREIWRVLRPGGFALIEGPPYAEPTDADIESGRRRGPEHRIAWVYVEGILRPHYAHDDRSLRRACDAAGVSAFQVFEGEWAGRRRLFLRLDKPRSDAGA